MGHTMRLAIPAPAILLMAALPAMAADQEPPRARTFHFEYQATVKAIPADAKHVDVWIPVPHDDAWQQIRDVRIESPRAYEVAEASHGNSMLMSASMIQRKAPSPSH